MAVYWPTGPWTAWLRHGLPWLSKVCCAAFSGPSSAVSVRLRAWFVPSELRARVGARATVRRGTRLARQWQGGPGDPLRGPNSRTASVRGRRNPNGANHGDGGRLWKSEWLDNVGIHVHYLSAAQTPMLGHAWGSPC
ncbi:hypothetical protein BGZ61DRAFT_437338 [Ilyonectria robusta]|uniref:uncharacterized protein n=1 Tax=Ilyonectria robusta TaxID=1079257 RepID=UPI001E8E5F99|nr:uncharacterized protein BGZ61DRAFT_437338 [Ilyonectria robusta]KAH8736948.1 hypothetical protein BGZ61DRAFT_437338 [Ilyonectria robusta]